MRVGETPQAESFEEIRVYGHSTCPMVPPVLSMLSRTDAKYAYVNIHKDESGRQHVKQINNGYESVPTLVFPDGSTLTEPSTDELRKKLEAIGYDVPLFAWALSWVMANLPMMIVFVIVIYALLSFFT